MSQIPLLDPALLSHLPPIALKALRVVEGTLSGLHQSPHHGQSIEFTEHKEYTWGDEIRHIDWKLYAKSDRYYVKQYEDETNLKAYLLIDASASMRYPEPGQSTRSNKFTYAATLALGIAYLLFRQHDAVGMLTFNEELRQVLPPRSRPSYLLPLAQALDAQTPSGQTALIPVLHQMAEFARRRSLLILFSDFFTEPRECLSLLKQFAHQGHDLVLFHILDPDETEFPFRDQTLFEDLEQENLRLQIDPNAIRPYYLQELQSYLDEMRKGTDEAGIEYWLVNTATPLENTLKEFLLQRHHLRRRRR